MSEETKQAGSSAVASGVSWVMIENIVTQLFNFGISIILARLLVPEAFGVIGIAMAIMNITQPFLGQDLAASLIRVKEINKHDYNTVFTFNLLASLAFMLLFFVGAPFVASFYEEPALTNILRFISISALLNALITVDVTVLNKQMKFKKKFFIRFPAMILSGSTAITLAFLGYGVWALAVRFVLFPLLQFVIFRFIRTIKYSLGLNKASFKNHFNFGVRLMATRFINLVALNAYTFIIGKVYTAADLGYYNRAMALKDLPIKSISTALDPVTYSAFSKIADQLDRLKAAYLKTFEMVFFILAPVIGFSIWKADEIILILLTEKWAPSIPYLRILLVGGLFLPFNGYNLNVLKVLNRTDLILKVELLNKVVIVIGLLLVYQQGVIYLIWFQVASTIFMLFVNSYFSGKFINMSVWVQFHALRKTTFVMAFVVGSMLLVEYSEVLSGLSPIVDMVLSTIAFGLAYLSLSFLLNRSLLVKFGNLFASTISKVRKLGGRV